ncbi:MAG: sigma-54-dependent transcriptional regulator [Negativicutes bacterium]
MANGRILLVEDDEDFGRSLALILKHKGFLPQWVGSGEQALAVLAEKHFDVVITDMLMPGMNGLEFLRQFRKTYGTETPIVMITGYGSVTEAVEAMKTGAFGYFLKPVNQDEICLTIEKAMEMGRLKIENLLLRQEIKESKGDLFIGVSSPIRHLFEEAAALAKSDVNVLITGESGSGKEVLARFIHDQSPRSTRPFLAINCQAYALSLIESELFGYRGGSFTGAKSGGKTGKIESAGGGTLFLDEIGDLDTSIQVKLLRVLETRTIEPVGGVAAVPVDFRLISATNQDLADRMVNKQFREDLYYRINTVKLYMPPLRERKEDIPALAAHFINRFSVEQKKGPLRLSKSAERRLLVHDWPGNIRELKNAMEAAVVLTKGSKIDVDALRVEGEKKCSNSIGLNFADARQLFERNYFQSQYESCEGNISEISRRTGVDRKQLYKKLNEYQMIHKFDTHPKKQ